MNSLTLNIHQWNALHQDHAVVASRKGQLPDSLLPNGQLLSEAERTQNVYKKLSERMQGQEAEHICCLQECSYVDNGKRMFNELLKQGGEQWEGGIVTYQKNTQEGSGILIKRSRTGTGFSSAFEEESLDKCVLSEAKTATIAVLTHKETKLKFAVVSAHFTGFNLLKPYDGKDTRNAGNEELKVLDGFLKSKYPDRIHIICADFNDVVPSKCTPQDKTDQQNNLTENRLALAEKLGFTYRDNDFSSEPFPPKNTSQVNNQTLDSQQIWPNGRTIDFLIFRLPDALAKQYRVELTTKWIYDDIVKKTSDHALLSSILKLTPIAINLHNPLTNVNNNSNKNNAALIKFNKKDSKKARGNTPHTNNSHAPNSPPQKQPPASNSSLLSSFWLGVCWAGRHFRWLLTCGWYSRKA